MHSHTWNLVDRALQRYRCSCGVVGRKAGVIGRTSRIVPYLCQHETDRRAGVRTHCGQHAVLVTGNRLQSRCADHLPINGASPISIHS